MSIFRALDVAQSALVANQRAMDVVSQNLAGAANPDYSRQQVELAARTPETIGGVVYGRGVDVRAVRRVVDPLVMGMLVDAHAEEGFARMRAQALADIAPVFGDATTSDLTDAVMRFFDAWRTFANQPADAGAQAQARVQSEALARTFRRQAAALDAALVRLDQQLRDRVTQANALLDQIAALNREIQRLEASNARPGAPANDLRDQRDAAVRKLAALISVQWIPSANGEPMLQLASGDLLVQGGKARHLVVDASGNLALAETQAPIQAPLRGEIGGLVQARQDIQTLRGALDQMARDL
ncbi:MAG: flagellar hook-associated protein FlgK, partial [Zetaproteobacteria bacterium]